MTNRAKWLFPAKKKKKKKAPSRYRAQGCRGDVPQPRSCTKRAPAAKGDRNPNPLPHKRGAKLWSSCRWACSPGNPQRTTRILPLGQRQPGAVPAHTRARALLVLLSPEPGEDRHGQTQVEPSENVFDCLDLSFCHSRKVPGRVTNWKD